MCTKVASSDAVRTRRSFSVNPAADLLQRNAYNSYMGQLAKNNRNYLDRVGKRGEFGDDKQRQKITKIEDKKNKNIRNLNLRIRT